MNSPVAQSKGETIVSQCAGQIQGYKVSMEDMIGIAGEVDPMVQEMFV